MVNAPRFPHRLVRASAGSGKTYALVHRFIGLLAIGTEPRRVLATTFTRKAAGEILARVMARLAGCVLDATVRDEVNVQIVPAPPLDAAAAERLLASVAESLPTLQVETLDAFFHRIAVGHGFELDLPPDWGVADSATLARIRRRAIADLLEADTDAAVELMHRLHHGDLRRSVTEQVDGLVVQLHQQWIESPEGSWDRIDVPPAPSAGDLAAARATLEALPVPETKAGKPNHHWVNARDGLLAILDEDRLEEIATNGVVRKVLAGEDRFARAEIEPEWIAALETPLAAARHRILRRLRDQNLASEELIRDYDSFERRRRDELGLYDFGTVTRRLAERHTTERILEVYERIDARIDHVLLDEFQDTSRLQYAVLRPVIEEVVAGGTEGRSVFCVGDVKQAIYGWRGGCRALFDVVEGLLPEGSDDSRSVSYRSSPVVLDAVNQVFDDLPAAFVEPDDAATARAWCDGFEPHHAHHGDRPGFVELRFAAREDTDVDGAGNPFDDRELPFLRALDTVEALHRAAPGASIGVLLRRRQRVGALIDLLRARGIDASQEGGNPLSDSPAVNRLLSLLTFADHPADRASLYAVVHSPLGGALGLSGTEDRARNAEVARAVRRALLDDGYGPTLRRYAAALAPVCDDRDRARLEQLVELADRIGDEAGLRPGAFVERVRTTPKESPTGSPVRVMTIHGSKGLEFDAVVLPQLTDLWLSPTPTILAAGDDPVLPPDHITRYVGKDVRALVGDPVESIYRGHRAETVTEALSVLYVALTRAKHALHLILPAGKLTDAPTFGRILRCTLAEDPEEEGGNEAVLHSSGDPEWWRTLGTPAPPTPVPAPPEGVAPLPERDGATVRPSDHEEVAPANGEATTSARVRRLARRRGTVVHALLEAIGWGESVTDATARDAALDAAVDRLPSSEGPISAAARAEITGALGSPSLRSLISESEARGRLTALAGAEPIALETVAELAYARLAAGDAIERGVIDRLHLARGPEGVIAAEIIDWKTDAAPEDPAIPAEAFAELLADRYSAQFAAYRAAVSELFSLDPSRITTTLVHVPSGTVVPVGEPAP